MAFSISKDEKTLGLPVYYLAGQYDAPGSVYFTDFTLSEGATAYGATIRSNWYVADIDVYDLGFLAAGYYSLDVDGNNWDWSNYISGYGSDIDEFGFLNSSGVVLAKSTDTLSDLYLQLDETAHIYAYVSGSSFSDAEYSITYDNVYLNNTAIIDLKVTGVLSPGEKLTVVGSASDPDGLLTASPTYLWYLDGEAISVGQEFNLDLAHAGKYLEVGIAFYDDMGFFEAYIEPIGMISSVQMPVQDPNASRSEFTYGEFNDYLTEQGLSDDTIKYLLTEPIVKWGGDLGTAPHLTFSITPAGPVDLGADYSLDGSVSADLSNYSGLHPDLYAVAFTDQEKAEIIEAVVEWSLASGLTFTEIITNKDDPADITFTKLDLESWSNSGLATSYLLKNPSAGFVSMFPDVESDYESGDVYINSDLSLPFKHVVSHELGHALGLAHPHHGYASYGDGKFPYADDLPNYLSIMSYDETNLLLPTAPMEYDLLAVQAIYGGMNANVGDNTYYFSVDEFRLPNSAGFLTRELVHDSDGHDEIIFVAENLGINETGVFYNFREGTFSSLGSNEPIWDSSDNLKHSNGNLFTSSGTKIEKVTTTQGSDVVYADVTWKTTVEALDGDDIVITNGNGSSLDGGSGLNDVLVLNYSTNDELKLTDIGFQTATSGKVYNGSGSLYCSIVNFEFITLLDEVTSSASTLSWEEFLGLYLPPQTPDISIVFGTRSSEKLGNRWEGLKDTDGIVTASFEVTDTSEDVVLSLNGYDIDNGSEVLVKLNGVSVGHLAKGQNNGISEHELTLDAGALTIGTNTLEFVQTERIANIWGVGDLLITQGAVGTPSAADISIVFGTRSSEKLGNRWEGLKDTDGIVTASFEVTDTSEDVVLSLNGYDIDNGSEVLVKLNGVSVGHLAKGQNNGISEHELTLDAGALTIGTNTLEFVQTERIANIWGVGDLLITQGAVGTPSAADISIVFGTRSSEKLGNRWEGLKDTDGIVTASFEVTDTSEDVVLSLNGYDIDNGSEVLVKLNGVSVGHLAKGQNNGISEHELTLDAGALTIGTNTLEFVQTERITNIWGVGDLLITQGAVGTPSAADISIVFGTRSSEKLGNRWEGLKDTDGIVTASFEVTDTSEDVVLSLNGYDIDNGSEVLVKLNGVSVGHLAKGQNNGISEHELTLDAGALTIGTNTLEFVQTERIANIWGVGDLLITQGAVGTPSAADISIVFGTRSSEKLGNRWEGLKDTDGIVTASFEVTDTSEDVVLSLNGYDIDNGSEVLVKLNGVSVGHLAKGQNNGISEHELTLDAGALTIGTNTLEFVQTERIANIWGVGDLLITQGAVGTPSAADISIVFGTRSSEKLGNRWEGLKDTDGIVTASFEVTDTSEDVVLSLNGYDIDNGSEVLVKLNGVSVGHLAKGQNNGISEHELTLDAGALTIGTNTLEFVQTERIANIWGVGDLLITQGAVGTPSAADISIVFGTRSSEKLGNRWEGLKDTDGIVTASFEVTDTSEDVVLSLNGYDIDNGSEVLVKLNGVSVGHLAKGQNNGISEHELTLDAGALTIGTNTLEFVQTERITNIWGVGDLLITQGAVGTPSAADISIVFGTRSSEKLGNRWEGLKDTDGIVTASFEVTDTSEDVVLSLNGYDIDNGSEVLVKLNGVSVGHLAKGQNNGISEHELTLDAGALTIGTNTLEFVQTERITNIWGVGDMLLTQMDSTPFSQSDLDAAVAAALSNFVDQTPFSQQDLDLISMAYYAAGVASVDITSDNAAVIAAALASADDLSPFSSADIAAAEAAATTSALTDAHGTVYATVDAAFDTGANSVDVTINDAEVVAAAILSVQAGTYYNHLRTYQEHISISGSSGCGCCSCHFIQQLRAGETPYSQSDIDGAVQAALTNYDNLTPYNQSDLDQAAIVALADGVASVDITSDNASVIAAALESHIDATPFTQSDIDQATTAAATAALTASNGVVYYSVDDAILAGIASVDVTSNDAEVIAAAIADYLQQNDSPTGAVTISGTVTEGETLTAVTSTIVDADGLGSFGYEWLRDGSSITGATSSTYTLTQSDVGAEISVRVSYTDGYGTSESLTSSATSSVANANDSPTGSVTVSGTATEGETLTAVTSSIADADGLGSFGYEWLRDGSSITGATSSTYTLTQSDVGAEISVTVSYTDGYGTSESLTSSTTSSVANANDSPTGSVTVSGTATEGETLTAVTSSIADADGLGSFGYQWLRDGSSITGATSSTYTLTQSDVGAEISVTVSYTDGYGTSESLTSSATSSVANANDSTTGSVTVSGTATEGETLTAVTSSIADADGLGSFGYQWLRDGSSITGATSSTYTLTQSDVGAEISVTVSYTDGSGTVESLTSEKTDYIYDDNGLQPYGGEITPGWLVFRAGSLSPDADWLPIQEAGNWPTGWEYSDIRYQYTITSFADLKSTFNNVSFPSSWSAGAPEGNIFLPFANSSKNQADMVVIYSSLSSPTDGKIYGDAIVTLGTELYTDDYVWAEIPNLQVGWVKISGTTELGQTLSADVSSELNVSNLKYQWLRDGSEITGATASTYLLGSSDIGKNISLELEYNSASMGTRLATSYETPAIANKTYANFADYRTDVVALTQGSHVEVLDLGQIDFSAPGRVTLSINGQDVATYDTSYSDADYSNATWANTASYVASWLSNYVRAWTDGVYSEHGGLPTGANSTDYFDQGDGKRHQPLIYLEGSTDETLNATVKFENGATGVVTTYSSIEASDPDIRGPELTSVSIREASLNAGETLYIDYTASDASGLQSIYVTFDGPTIDGIDTGSLSYQDRSPDGVLEILIPETKSSGAYELNHIQLVDNADNYSVYTESSSVYGDVPGGGTHTFNFDLLDFDLVNTNDPDIRGPELTSVSIREASLNAGETLYIDYTASDASGLQSIYVTFDGPTIDGIDTGSLSYQDRSPDGVLEILIPETKSSGAYELNHIQLVDNADNYSVYTESSSVYGDVPGGGTHTFNFDLLDFDLVNTNDPDIRGPELTSVSIREASLNAGETLYIDYTASDASGLQSIYVTFDGPTIDGIDTGSLSYQDRSPDGVLEILIPETKSSGAYELNHIQLVDNADNYSVYTESSSVYGDVPGGGTHTFNFDLLDFEIIA